MAADAMVAGDDQPQELPCVMVSSTADRPAARPAAPNQSIVPSAPPARDGMATSATAMTNTTNPVASQNTR